jgi:hypothetical protein
MQKKGRTGADQKREKYSLFIADDLNPSRTGKFIIITIGQISLLNGLAVKS